jgi:hypothetical protein
MAKGIWKVSKEKLGETRGFWLGGKKNLDGGKKPWNIKLCKILV